MIEWLSDPTILKYGRALTSGNDLAVSWAAFLVCVMYYPLVMRYLPRMLRREKVTPHQSLFVGIFLTAAGIGLLRFYWSIWRALPDGDLQAAMLLVGNYTSAVVGLSLIGYTIHLHTIWRISGRSNKSYLALLSSLVIMFVLGFWNTIRA